MSGIAHTLMIMVRLPVNLEIKNEVTKTFWDHFRVTLLIHYLSRSSGQVSDRGQGVK